MPLRYALYFAPEEDSTLHKLGSAWLGRDAAVRRFVEQPRFSGITPAGFNELTAPPRRYGLHATLKPPFRLAKGFNLDDLVHSLNNFTKKRTRFELPPLRLTWLGLFLALTPSAPCTKLHELADGCVREFDLFRAPAPPEETERRLSAGLNSLQMDMLRAWGYPYVMNEYRFHITLSCSLKEKGLRQKIEQAAQKYFSRVFDKSQPVISVCLFTQPHPDQPFVLLERFTLARGHGEQRAVTAR